jgi:glycerophosphoryl diester phosphodiesterase
MAPAGPMTEDPGRVVAHRGASRVAPENTLAAFRAAARQGARWIEFDVSPLGDGTPVVFHDGTLDRCTDATGPLAAIGHADLSRIHAGVLFGPEFVAEPLPTLDAVLDVVDELGLCANLEIKAHRDRPGRRVGDLAGRVAHALARRPWATARIVVSSFDEDELVAFREAAPEMPVALLCEDPPADWQARLRALAAEGLHLDFRHLDRDLLSQARASGFRVRVYTVNDPALMVPFREQGLTGVITDHPPLFLDDPDWAAWARR